MTSWTAAEADKITAPQEIGLATRRRDGSTRNPRIIWIVRVEDRVFIRSTNGRSADWFRWATATGLGQVIAGDGPIEVRFVEADASDLSAVDDAYRSKYGRYGSIVDHLQEPGPRGATLEVLPT